VNHVLPRICEPIVVAAWFNLESNFTREFEFWRLMRLVKHGCKAELLISDGWGWGTRVGI